MHAVVNKLYYQNNYFFKKNAHARISEGKRRFGYPFARLAIEFSLVLLSIGPPFDFSLKAVATRRLDIKNRVAQRFGYSLPLNTPKQRIYGFRQF